ncbi:MAG: hypothetical protein I3273_01690 [Candidatus Moeniiplasma glomeromycotorum]|nr:hypothetical protein [Candidatus Moeniiplasma glomeromycotorum]MCE8167167.1 hypothetical protein [Candidatus Moeniiplasma glomeromycotorum]MCE8168821.1 hypothetical protein [Candidatus Moeniiplasma glomeromycotorum]
MQRKTKNKLLKTFTDEELLGEIISRSGSKKGLPTKAKCFRCSKNFWIKWNNATRSHSKLYSLEYWISEKTKDMVCSDCLRFLWTSPDSESSSYREKIGRDKRKLLSAYLTANRI